MSDANVEFKVYDKSSEPITVGLKVRGGLCDSRSHLEINFLSDMDWKHRSLIMACYLIADYMAFDTQNCFN